MSWQGQVLYEYYAENLYKALKNGHNEDKQDKLKGLYDLEEQMSEDDEDEFKDSHDVEHQMSDDEDEFLDPLNLA